MKIRLLLAVLAASFCCTFGAEASAEEPDGPTGWQSHEVQRGIKRANEGVVSLGIFQIVITGLGTFGVLWSLHMSRAALYQARVSAEIQRDVAREELRGYLSADVPIVERCDAKGLRVTYNLRNVGGTALRNVRMWSYAKVIKGKHEAYDTGEPDVLRDANPRTVPPGGVIGFAADYEFGTPEEAERLATSKDTLVTAYLLRYEDIFGHQRFVGYSEVRRGNGLTFRTINKTFVQKCAHLLDILPPIPTSLHESESVQRVSAWDWVRTYFRRKP